MAPKGAANGDRSRSHKKQSSGEHPRTYDLRPSFAKSGLTAPPKTEDSEGSQSHGISNLESQELLFTESKVVEVFDLLASRINKRLDYPWLLAENGVQGVATLELFFDHKGGIDESRSKFSGDSRTVRGLLVKAAREGLVEWFSNDAQRIKREQFRDQYFRADFVISGNMGDSELSKVGRGSYHLIRRHYVRGAKNCFTSTQIGTPSPLVDLACLGAKIMGSIKGKMDSKYVARFNALRDTLEEYDTRELRGINSQIRGNS